MGIIGQFGCKILRKWLRLYCLWPNWPNAHKIGTIGSMVEWAICIAILGQIGNNVGGGEALNVCWKRKVSNFIGFWRVINAIIKRTMTIIDLKYILIITDS